MQALISWLLLSCTHSMADGVIDPPDAICRGSAGCWWAKNEILRCFRTCCLRLRSNTRYVQQGLEGTTGGLLVIGGSPYIISTLKIQRTTL